MTKKNSLIPRPISKCGTCYLGRSINESESLVECGNAIEKRDHNITTIRSKNVAGKCIHFASRDEWDEAQKLHASMKKTLSELMWGAA